MLRTNLSTRPFYNERLVHLALLLFAVIVGVITLINLVRVVQLSQQNTALSARIREDRAAADDFNRRAQQTRQGINQNELKLVVASAREANALIDGRTFSWTQFFNHIEGTLPPDVMIMMVRPEVEPRGTKITMMVSARKSPDIDEFMDKLEATGAFPEVLLRQDTLNEEGLWQATIEAFYAPDQAEPVQPSPSEKPSGDKGAGAKPPAGKPADKAPTDKAPADKTPAPITAPAPAGRRGAL